MSDWYLARQLENFRQGIRGTHPQDFHGAQMRSMAQALKDEASINDLTTYTRFRGIIDGIRRNRRPRS